MDLRARIPCHTRTSINGDKIMNKESIKTILSRVKEKDLSVEDATTLLCGCSYKDIGCAKIDFQRKDRTGHPEVIFCQGKSTSQIERIIATMLENESNILATRVEQEVYDSLKEKFPTARYNRMAKTLCITLSEPETTESYIAIVTAGTSDLPVAEEAMETATMLGSRVELIADVGVAGIHRLFDNMDIINGARVVVVVAGMEGALASIVGGLVSVPVVAVPTSVGYGTHLGGITTLFAMLTSCSDGIAAVNIDNGYGAGYYAHMINSMK